MKDVRSATTMPDDSVLGFGALLELFDDDAQAVLALLQTAMESIANDVQRIEAAELAGNAGTVAEATHRLKGTSGSISAKRLTAVVSSLEVTPHDSTFAKSSLILELHAAVDEISEAVAEFASFAGSSARTT
jgi:HPt (histidine-containing phosphotransfer) domain-containing protein